MEVYLNDRLCQSSLYMFKIPQLWTNFHFQFQEYEDPKRSKTVGLRPLTILPKIKSFTRPTKRVETLQTRIEDCILQKIKICGAWGVTTY